MTRAPICPICGEEAWDAATRDYPAQTCGCQDLPDYDALMDAHEAAQEEARERYARWREEARTRR